MKFCDWDGRPAVFVSARSAYAFIKGSWKPVEPADIVSGAAIMSAEAFAREFPEAFPLPNFDQLASSDSKTAA